MKTANDQDKNVLFKKKFFSPSKMYLNSFNEYLGYFLTSYNMHRYKYNQTIGLYMKKVWAIL